LRHEERRPNPSSPKGLGVNQEPPRVPHGRSKVLLKDRAKKMEETIDRGKRVAAAAGRREEIRVGRVGKKERREITAGGLNTTVKINCRYYQPKGRYHRRARNLRREWPTGATGLRPVSPAGAGTTGAGRRYHRQDRESAQRRT